MTRPNAYLVLFNRTYLNISQSWKKEYNVRGGGAKKTLSPSLLDMQCQDPRSIRIYFLKTKKYKYMIMNIEHSNTMLLSRIMEKHKIQIKNAQNLRRIFKVCEKCKKKCIKELKYRICQILLFGRGKIKRGIYISI